MPHGTGTYYILFVPKNTIYKDTAGLGGRNGHRVFNRSRMSYFLDTDLIF
jgi:hypothetical protein